MVGPSTKRAKLSSKNLKVLASESDVHFEAIYEEQNRVYDEVSSCGEAFNSYKEAFVLSKSPTFMMLLKASDEKPLDDTKNCC